MPSNASRATSETRLRRLNGCLFEATTQGFLPINCPHGTTIGSTGFGEATDTPSMIPTKARAEHAISARGWSFDFSPLCHPLWWSALALLLVNDNLLKGSGIVPGWLTGKLSDFAFLVVAPVLCASLLPLRLPKRRVLAFAAVTAVFVTADLSTAVSDAIVALAARVGLRWRLWPDATDLLALSVLPVGWYVAGAQRARALYPIRRVLQPAGLAVGVLACLATSSANGYEHYPFVVNRASTPQKLSLTWLLRRTDCGVDLAKLASTLSSSDLDDDHSVTLTSGQVAALDLPPGPQDTVAGTCQNAKPQQQLKDCMAVVVSVENGPAVLVANSYLWVGDPEGTPFLPFSCSSTDTPSKCSPVMSTTADPGPDALSLVESGGQIVFQAGGSLNMVSIAIADVLARAPSIPGCRELRGQIETLVDGSRACATDADCQVLYADFSIPGAGICDVYVNRSVSYASVESLRDQWNWGCATVYDSSCSTNQVHPPTCQAGRCEELCPDAILPSCPATCASLGLAVNQACAAASVGSCLGADGQLCTCTGARSTLICAPQAPIPGCGIACTSTYPVTAGIASLDAAPDDAVVDAGAAKSEDGDAATFDGSD